MDTTATAGEVDIDEGQRPTALLPVSHLLRISAYWLGLTVIDAAVGLVIQNRIQFDRALVPDPLLTGTAA